MPHDIGGRDIFICDSLKANAQIFDPIWKYIRDDVCHTPYRAIDNKEFARKLRNGKAGEIRFACLSDGTLSIIIEKLFSIGVPILFINCGCVDKLKSVMVDMLEVDQEQFKRMVYRIEKPDQIQGALNWVHSYFYTVCAKGVPMAQQARRKELNFKKVLDSFVAEKEIKKMIHLINDRHA